MNSYDLAKILRNSNPYAKKLLDFVKTVKHDDTNPLHPDQIKYAELEEQFLKSLPDQVKQDTEISKCV